MTRVPMGELLDRGERALLAAGVDAPRREALLLLGHALGLDRLGLLSLDRNAGVAPEEFDALVRRRAAREPLAFLVGRQGFWTLDLAVTPDTLIPRADSETLIEALLEARPDRDAVTRILDLGTGTGCLLLAALAEYPQARGVGVDLSPAACRLARANARSNGLADRSAMVCGSWASALAGRFDVVLGNPPYIPRGDLAGLMPEVAGHEPARALDGGPDGLDMYRRLLPALPDLLAPGGLVVLEVGVGQAGPVAAIGVEAGLVPAGCRRDLGGVERAVLLEKEKTFGSGPARR